MTRQGIPQRLKIAASASALLALAGCLSSSNDPPPPFGNNLPTPDPLAGAQPATNFETVEFFANYGLDQIGAQDVYAKGAYGGGVVVAVIDTGIEATHSDLDANISGDSIDIAGGGTSIGSGGTIADDDGHGTHVAGTIAAEKNGVGMHGVAFDATILAIRADTPSAPGSFTVADVIAGLDYAAGKAHVINLSLGGPSPLGPAFERSLRSAMSAGAIVVAATGNDGVTQPGYPAIYAGNPRVNGSGQLIAVGAVDNTGTIATFSNQCGVAMNFCLVAPGVDILSTVPGNGLAVYSGTSMATPHVSGAAALLIQAWPMTAPGDIVQILLTTATDLGAPGVDTIYGHGLLNLGAAIAPLGVLAIPLTDSATGETVMLAGTVLSLGPAFGDALGGSRLLGEAFALDDYDRNYAAGLDGHVIRAERSFGLQALMSGGGIESIESALPNGATVSMGVTDRDTTDSAARWTGMAADVAPERQLRGMNLSVAGSDGTAYRFGYGITPEQHLPGTAAAAAASLFWMPGDLLGPQHALVGAGAAFSASREVGGGNVITLGLVEEGGAQDGAAGDARIGEIVFAHRFAGGAVLTAGFSSVDEQSGFLGSEAGGGLAVEGADSRFYVLGGRVPLGAGVELLGSYTLGQTDMTADGTSLLSDWSGARADAFGVGIVKRDIFGTNGRIGFLAGQPLRVNAASARLTVPVDYQIDKTVVQGSERVSLVPTGREIDLQLAYDTSVGARGSVSGWLMMQVEPGHDADAAPAYGVGLRFKTAF